MILKHGDLKIKCKLGDQKATLVISEAVIDELEFRIVLPDKRKKHVVVTLPRSIEAKKLGRVMRSFIMGKLQREMRNQKQDDKASEDYETEKAQRNQELVISYKEAMQDHIESLEVQEADVVCRRYGLFDNRLWSPGEVAKELNIPVPRVHQLERIALVKIKKEKKGGNQETEGSDNIGAEVVAGASTGKPA